MAHTVALTYWTGQVTINDENIAIPLSWLLMTQLPVERGRFSTLYETRADVGYPRD